MKWQFDGAIILWNSIGFASRDVDHEAFSGIFSSLRDGGKLLIDLYNPRWMRENQQSGGAPEKGASVVRWVNGSRCYHRITYSNGVVDSIEFELYEPDEMMAVLRSIGFEVGNPMTWWNVDNPVESSSPRYQLQAIRTAASSV
jgi:hypothetical protein